LTAGEVKIRVERKGFTLKHEGRHLL